MRQNFLGNNDDVKYEMVTPDKAQEWLRSSPGNRKLNMNTVSIYAESLKNDRFFPGNDCVIFDKKGRLRNGHHRCTAIIISGVSVVLLVRRNVDDEEITSMDVGNKRSLVDATRFNPEFGDISELDGKIMRAMLTNGYKVKSGEIDLGHEALATWIKKFRTNIDFVVHNCFGGRSHPKVGSASVLAVFVKAELFGVSHDKLKYAAKFLVEGRVPSAATELTGTRSLQKLRDFLIGGKYQGQVKQSEVYDKTQNMLQAFLNGEERDKVTRSQLDLFPSVSAPRIKKISSIDPMFLYNLNKVTNKMKSGDSYTPLEIGTMLYEMGQSAKGINPKNALSTQFARMVRTNGGELKVNGGVFRPSEFIGTKIRKYIFINSENFYLQQIRA